MSILNPDHRGLYVDALRPPPGHAFDLGIATTYSLDLETLLTLPLHLVLYAGDETPEAMLQDGVALLDSLRRVTRRLQVYCDRGHIKVPRTQRALYGLLEPMIRQVALDADRSRGGSFHPKVWLLRYVNETDPEKPAYRLLVMSRNITGDLSWDVSLILEGDMGRRERPSNDRLVGFLKSLDPLAEPVADDSPPPLLTPAVLEELSRVRWVPPKPFSRVIFHHLAPGGRSWLPKPSKRLLVVSPFLTRTALDALAGRTEEPVALVSRPETFSDLDRNTLDRWGRQLVLHDAAVTEDGEALGEEPDRLASAGLHAKVYVAEEGSVSRVYVGSANATTAALNGQTNVEFMVELPDWTERGDDDPGLIDAFLGEEGIGPLLSQYREGEQPEEDARKAEERALLESAQDAIRKADLRLSCSRTGEQQWALTLQASSAVDLPSGVRLWWWPVSVHPDQRMEASDLQPGSPSAAGPFSVQSLTTLVAFQALPVDPVDADARQEFVLRLPIEGMPEELRDEALIRQVVSRGDGFLRYLLLLLGDLDPASGSSDLLGRISFASDGAGRIALEDLPLLEVMTRAFARDPDKLDQIQGLVNRLKAGTEDGESVIPPEFEQVWQAFEAARSGAS